ncbi:uncharacterized protein LOC144097579 [Amblyomma americanum]
MDNLLTNRYKKTEGGISVQGEAIKDLNGVTLGHDRMKQHVEAKYLHFGIHKWIDKFSVENFKTKFMPYLKSINENLKQLKPDRMSSEAPDPLYGFVGFQVKPYKKEDVVEAAKAMENAIGLGVLFIIHTNFEMPNDDTKCVYGGTPLNLPGECEKPTFSDYVAMQDSLAFTKGSKVAAVFDMAVVETQFTEVPVAKKFSEMTKSRELKSSLKEITAACKGTQVLTEAGMAAITGKVDGTTVYAYDDVTTWQFKLSKILGKTAPHHLGFAVTRVDYDREDCDQQRSYKRLEKFKSTSRISRQ